MTYETEYHMNGWVLINEGQYSDRLTIAQIVRESKTMVTVVDENNNRRTFRKIDDYERGSDRPWSRHLSTRPRKKGDRGLNRPIWITEDPAILERYKRLWQAKLEYDKETNTMRAKLRDYRNWKRITRKEAEAIIEILGLENEDE